MYRDSIDENLEAFEQLKSLVLSQKVSLGVNLSQSNNFFYSQTNIGKLLNWGTNGLIIFGIVFLIIRGLAVGLLILLSLPLYTYTLQKVAAKYYRSRLLNDQLLFEAAYNSRSVTIRINTSGEVFSYPSPLSSVVDEIAVGNI